MSIFLIDKNAETFFERMGEGSPWTNCEDLKSDVKIFGYAFEEIMENDHKLSIEEQAKRQDSYLKSLALISSIFYIKLDRLSSGSYNSSAYLGATSPTDENFLLYKLINNKGHYDILKNLVTGDSLLTREWEERLALIMLQLSGQNVPMSKVLAITLAVQKDLDEDLIESLSKMPLRYILAAGNIKV